MAATPKQVIESALHKLVVLDPHEVAPDYLIQRGLENLRQMLESWSTEGLYVPAYTHESFELDGTKREYTIGVGGDFDTTRPMSLAHVRIEDDAGAEYQVDIASLDIWAEIEWKNSQEYVPDYLYYEPKYPLGVIRLSSLPFDGYWLKLVSLKPIAELPQMTKELSFPPGYERAMVYGLCLEMAPEFGLEATNTIARSARDAIKGLKHANAIYRQRTLEVDSGLSQAQRYDITQGPGAR